MIYKINPKRIFVLVALICILSSCQVTLKQEATIKTPIQVSENSTKPIGFKKIVIKLRPGEEYGKIMHGVPCMERGKLRYGGGRMQVKGDLFNETFIDVLTSNNYKVVGNPNALFADKSINDADYFIAGTIKKLEANVCYPLVGFGDWDTSSGAAYMDIEWQLYDTLNRRVVYTTNSSGSHKTEAMPGGSIGVLTIAFGNAVNNLLSNQDFHDHISGKIALSRNIKGVKRTLKFSELRGRETKNLDEIRHGVVTVRTATGHGSGFLVSGDGLIITNEHVIGDSKKVKIIFWSGRQAIGIVQSRDSTRDVALIKIDENVVKHLVPAKVESRVGEDVMAIGAPLSEKLQGTVSKGIISSYRIEKGLRYIQSDVNILPGSSGGPLINSKGHVLGISVKGLFIKGSPVGINYFIPITDVFEALNIEIPG
jgi:serine protease Do